MSEPKTFWVVWCASFGPPTIRQISKDSAVNEAKRLAGANHGQQFFVLESIGFAQKVDVGWTPTVEDDGSQMPF
jgi:hypothetical protein